MNWIQIVACVLLFTYGCFVLESTVFTRNNQGYHDYELELFWSWKAVFFWHSKEMLKENLLNMVMLLPVGLLLPLFAYKKLKWWQGLLVGVGASALIEILQLVLCRGLFEFDDIVHNTLGCMLGCMIMGVFMKRNDEIIKR